MTQDKVVRIQRENVYEVVSDQLWLRTQPVADFLTFYAVLPVEGPDVIDYTETFTYPVLHGLYNIHLYSPVSPLQDNV